MIRKSFGQSLTTTESNLYEVPTGKKTEWRMMYASNIAGSNASFSVRIYKAADNVHLQMFDSFSVSSKDFFHIGGENFEFVMLDEGDIIKVTGQSNNDITLLVSVVEHNNLIQGG